MRNPVYDILQKISAILNNSLIRRWESYLYKIWLKKILLLKTNNVLIQIYCFCLCMFIHVIY